MHRYALALAAICLFAVATILLLRPDPAVELEARLSRLEPDEALALLDGNRYALPSSKNLHLMHARLAAAAGDAETAQAAYLSVIEIGGPTPAVYDEMAEVAALSGNMPRAATYKASAQAMDPDPERREQLGYWYRLLGWADEETDLLSATPPDRLSAFERVRLAELYLAAGDVAAYREMLTVISTSNSDGVTAARRELLELDLGSGETGAALAHAIGWFNDAPEDHSGLDVSLKTFIGRGAVDQAVALAELAVATNPEIGAVPTENFLATGHGGIGRQMQAAWLATDPALSAADWDVLVTVAERTGDLRALQQAIARRLPEDEPAPARAFLQFLRYQGPRALLPFRPHMTPAAFEDEPLVGAAWYGWHRQFPRAYDHLLAAAAAPLNDWDRSIWMSVASDLQGTPFYRELLAGAPEDARLRDMLSLQLRAPVELSR